MICNLKVLLTLVGKSKFKCRAQKATIKVSYLLKENYQILSFCYSFHLEIEAFKNEKMHWCGRSGGWNPLSFHIWIWGWKTLSMRGDFMWESHVWWFVEDLIIKDGIGKVFARRSTNIIIIFIFSIIWRIPIAAPNLRLLSSSFGSLKLHLSCFTTFYCCTSFGSAKKLEFPVVTPSYNCICGRIFRYVC